MIEIEPIDPNSSFLSVEELQEWLYGYEPIVLDNYCQGFVLPEQLVGDTKNED